MVIAMTGVTGFLGQSVAGTALGKGIDLRALTRKSMPDPERTSPPPLPRLTLIAGDLANRAALIKLCSGAEAMIHVAGLVNTPDPTRFIAANIDGTANVVEAMQATGVSRLIYVSSLSAREPALSAYGASKAQAEQLVMASGLDWTIVRPPTIYGPRDVDMFELFRAARWGIVPVPARGRSSIIHVDDAAALLLALIPGNDQVTHRTFEPDDGRLGGWTHRDLALAIGQAVGRRPLVLPLSARVMRWAARADMRLRGPDAKLTLDRVGYMTHPDWVVSASAQVPPALWQSHIPTGAGLKATARWYRQKGWL